MRKLLNSKGLRMLLYIVVLIVLFVVDGLIWGNIDSEFCDQFGGLTVLGLVSLIGSIFYLLAYDTLYKQNARHKRFFQKVFIVLGLIMYIIIGSLTYVFYFQSFEYSANYSPWAFAITAPWLMSGLLTLFLYEWKIQYSNVILKYLLPYISLIISYLIHVLLGYLGRDSIFVYGGIGAIICVLIFVVLFFMWKSSWGGSSSSSSSSGGRPTSSKSSSSSSSAGNKSSDSRKENGGRALLEKEVEYALYQRFCVGGTDDYRYGSAVCTIYWQTYNYKVNFDGSTLSIDMNPKAEVGAKHDCGITFELEASDVKKVLSEAHGDISSKAMSEAKSVIGKLRKKYKDYDNSIKVNVNVDLKQ